MKPYCRPIDRSTFQPSPTHVLPESRSPSPLRARLQPRPHGGVSKEGAPERRQVRLARRLVQDGEPLEGHFTTFTLGFVAFQIFTVDFATAERLQARAWNTAAPAALRDSVHRIWPQADSTQTISWPTRLLEFEQRDRLVTWNGALRRRGPG
jgi:hypothetical protein